MTPSVTAARPDAHDAACWEITDNLGELWELWRKAALPNEVVRRATACCLANGLRDVCVEAPHPAASAAMARARHRVVGRLFASAGVGSGGVAGGRSGRRPAGFEKEETVADLHRDAMLAGRELSGDLPYSNKRRLGAEAAVDAFYARLLPFERMLRCLDGLSAEVMPADFLPMYTQDHRCCLLRSAVGNPFAGRVVGRRRDGTADSAFVNDDVVRMAKAMVMADDYKDAAVLGDALEEAGCDDLRVLRHLRSVLPVVDDPQMVPARPVAADLAARQSRRRSMRDRGKPVAPLIDMLRNFFVQGLSDEVVRQVASQAAAFYDGLPTEPRREVYMWGGRYDCVPTSVHAGDHVVEAILAAYVAGGGEPVCPAFLREAMRERCRREERPDDTQRETQGETAAETAGEVAP